MRTEIELYTGQDDALLLATSWEERCLGHARRLKNYKARRVILTQYDSPSTKRALHTRELLQSLEPVGNVSIIPTSHANPLTNVRETIDLLNTLPSPESIRLTIDISTYTRKHLLQLLQGLELSGQMNKCRFIHTEPPDYDTRDDEPVSVGVSDVRAIETFAGPNRPSKDTLLIVFLGYEGRRATALWEHLDPNVTLAVVAEPSYRPEWKGRSQALNHYLLSCIPQERVLKVSAFDPQATEDLLTQVLRDARYSSDKYNIHVAPVGPKPQVIGLYRFWRRNPAGFTVMYASPARYREEHALAGTGKTWLVDDSATWPELEPSR